MFSSGIIVFILKIIGAGLSLLNTIIIAKELGVDDAGIYFFAFSLLVLLGTFSRLGVDNVIVKSSSLHSSTAEMGKVKYEFLLISIVIFFFSCFVCFIISLSIFFGAFSSLNEIYLYFFLGVTGLSLSFIVSNFLLGIGYPVLSTFMVSVLIPSVFLFLLYAYKYSSDTLLTLEACFMLYCITVFLVGAFSFLFFCYKVRYVNKIKSAPKSLYFLSKIFFISVIADLVFLNTPIFVLEKFSTPADVALYSVSFRIATLLAFVFVSLNRVISPSFTVMYAKSMFFELFLLIKKCVALILSCGAFFMILCYFFSDYILLLFGEEYLAASSLLLLFVLFQMLCSLYYFIRNIFQLTGQEQKAKKNDFLLAIIGLCSSLILTPIFDSNGAIVSLIISVFITLLISVNQLYKSETYSKYRNNVCR